MEFEVRKLTFQFTFFLQIPQDTPIGKVMVKDDGYNLSEEELDGLSKLIERRMAAVPASEVLTGALSKWKIEKTSNRELLAWGLPEYMIKKGSAWRVK